jgi:hypothetical protein
MPLLYRQYAISLDRPRFQLFGSLHLVVDGSNSNGRLRLPQECNEQMRVMERRVETTRRAGGVKMAWDRWAFPCRFRSVETAVDS